jgi:hypothetical protein
MQASTPEQFVEDLEIEILGSGRLWRSGDPAGLTDSHQRQAASANVDAASLVTFVDGLSGQQKEDVLNSTLYAQLAANRKHDRERDTGGWYNLYRTVLEQLGWVSRKSGADSRVSLSRGLQPGLDTPLIPDPRPPRPVLTLPFTRVVAKEPRFTPDTAALRLLKPISSEREVSVTKATLDVFRELPDRDRRVVIFESSSHSAASGNFQIVVVNVSPDGTVVMTIAAFFFRTDQPVTRVLSFTFGQRTTEMFQARHVMALDEAVYSRVRRRVIDQLGDQASALIDDLKI